ncbi:MAG: accessory factor UbiK family protein [Micavibrio sp.]|nr:accessory factor UbiK family protein [Micavibrio sp.]
MPRKEKIFDDMARVAGGAAGVFSGLSSNIRKEIKSCVDDVITRLDLVPREDFDRAMEMLSEYRIQQENLKTRIEKLEKNSKPSATKKGTKS